MKLNRYLSLVVLILTLVMNTAAVLLPLNGISTQAVSNIYFTYFTPANFTFGIWSVIYTGLIIYTVYQLLPRNRESSLIDKLNPWFIFSGIANTLWLVAWHYQVLLVSVGLMLSLLASLIVIYRKIDQHQLNLSEFAFIKLPFSIYLGWISVATIANLASFFQSIGFDGGLLSGVVWANIMVVVACLLGILMLVRKLDFAYAAVLVWAFWGINRNFPQFPLTTNTTFAAMTILAIGIVVCAYLKLKTFKLNKI